VGHEAQRLRRHRRGVAQGGERLAVGPGVVGEEVPVMPEKVGKIGEVVGAQGGLAEAASGRPFQP